MRNMVVRVMFNMTDAGKIRQTREMIITAVSRFQVYIFKFVSSLLLRLLLGPFSYKDERTFARSCGEAEGTSRGFEKSLHTAGGGGRRGRGILTSTSATDQQASGIRRSKLVWLWRFDVERFRKYIQSQRSQRR